MKYIKLPESYPVKDVDVFVVTATGKKGVARYWDVTGKWLTQNGHLGVCDIIVKWRYANAVNDKEIERQLNLHFKD